MEDFNQLTEKIKILKKAKVILNEEYKQSDFHKKKEANPQETVPPSPEDEEVFKLLTAISQIDNLVKKYQNDQFTILKEDE